MKILKIIFFVFTMLLSLSASATVYNVLGGTFTLSGITLDTNSTGGTLNINEGANAYQGFGEILDPFMFSGFDVNIQTASSVAGISGGGNAPSGNVVDGGVVDMSAFFINWNNNDLWQGSISADVTAISGGYQISWIANQSGPKLAPSQWTIDIAAVPLPAAGWLMLSGLTSLLGFACRRKSNTKRC